MTTATAVSPAPPTQAGPTAGLVLLPGDELPLSDADLTSTATATTNTNNNANNQTITFGPGIVKFPYLPGGCGARKESDRQRRPLAVFAGEWVEDVQNRRRWVDFNKTKYHPSVDDFVIATVTSTHADTYRLDLHSSFTGTLSQTAFENATKRNRPQLEVGDSVFARVSRVDGDLDTELECTSKAGKGEGYGELKGGMVCEVEGFMVRSLLSPSHNVLLTEISRYIPFEIAVGLNHRVWVHAGPPALTSVVVQMIRQARFLTRAEVPGFVKGVLGAGTVGKTGKKDYKRRR